MWLAESYYGLDSVLLDMLVFLFVLPIPHAEHHPGLIQRPHNAVFLSQPSQRSDLALEIRSLEKSETTLVITACIAYAIHLFNRDRYCTSFIIGTYFKAVL